MKLKQRRKLMTELRPFEKATRNWESGLRKNPPNEDDYCCYPNGCGELNDKCFCNNPCRSPVQIEYFWHQEDFEKATRDWESGLRKNPPSDKHLKFCEEE
jgi:hypothetical protein